MIIWKKKKHEKKKTYLHLAGNIVSEGNQPRTGAVVQQSVLQDS